MREEKIAMVVGSLIVGLIKTMDDKQQSKGSVINLVNLLRSRIRRINISNEEREGIAYITRDSMLMLVDQFADEENTMAVATFVESLSFSFEKEMVEFYGQHYINVMLRFADKQAYGNQYAKDSYKLSDQLRDNIRKIIYDRERKSA